MAELVPSEAILLLYRRYLKASSRIPNGTIKLLLMQQIRNGFRKHRGVRSALAQRELVNQAHQDLMILEDDRHQRTLYINRFGMVSCMEWEVRRSEWHFTPRAERVYQFFMAGFIYFVVYVATHTQMVDSAHPDIAQTVDLMMVKMEADNPQQLLEKRERDAQLHLDAMGRRRSLEERILATFHEAPDDPQYLAMQREQQQQTMPTVRNPSGSRRFQSPDSRSPSGITSAAEPVASAGPVLGPQLAAK
jgi:hypothetical protein